jgi:hypothetical protein
MTIGYHTQNMADMVILSGVEGCPNINHVSTPLNMTGATCRLIYVNHSRYPY